MTLDVRHRIDGLEKLCCRYQRERYVRHRIDGLETVSLFIHSDQRVRHRLDGLEMPTGHHGWRF